MAREHRVGWVAALVLAALLPAAAAAGPAFVGQEQVDADRVVLGVELRPDGDAQWRIEHRVRLASDNETAAFEELQRDVRANESLYADRFRDRMARTAATAENATGRTMAIENVTVAAEQRSLPQTYGVLTYRFRWTNFAAVDGETIRAGDALAGLFLDSVTTLRITWPDGYEATAVRPDGDERDATTVVWRGPHEFGPDEPSVVVAPATATPSETETAARDAGGPGLVPWLGGLALVGALAVVGYAAVRRRRGPAPDGDASAGDGGGPPTDESGGGAVAAPGDADQPPADLLSNEEQVLRLLEANGGRMKQQAVAEELDWTAAKTSQVVGDMRDAGAVDTFRLGRENVVTLPDEGLGDELGPDGDST